VLVGSKAVEGLIVDRRIVAVTLTGSEQAGSKVASQAGREIKKTVLELGGSDPFIVLEDADVGDAARTAASARLVNSGQSCIAAKRFIVHEDVADAFEELFVTRMQALRVGDPMDEHTDIGPLANEQGVLDVERYMSDALALGARVLCGGVRIDRPGYFYPATVVTDITPEMRMYHEEIFGPVAQLFRVRDADEAIALSNATVFGLGSNVWTRDADEQERFVRALDAGAVFVNGMTTSYPELPFGGVRESGFGRELSSQGIRAFCNVKTVWVG
jgi:succinate-semialdehyde dehydrogenase / glutarate-semialdehyde dehydrogenase